MEPETDILEGIREEMIDNMGTRENRDTREITTEMIIMREGKKKLKKNILRKREDMDKIDISARIEIIETSEIKEVKEIRGSTSKSIMITNKLMGEEILMISTNNKPNNILSIKIKTRWRMRIVTNHKISKQT